MSRTHELLLNREWLIQKYHDERMSTIEVGAEIGVSGAAVTNAMKRLGIKARTPLETRVLRGNTERVSPFPILRDREWLYEQYHGKGMSIEEIAVQVGCNSTPVQRALKKLGIPTRTPGAMRSDRNRSDRHPELYDKEWLIEQYLTLQRPIAEIALGIGCAESTLIGALARYFIHRKEPRPKTNAEALIDVRRTKTGISSTGKRYIRVWMPEHPNEVMGYVLEHRLVCEKELGRYLTKKEVVHHVNDNSEDNRPENLMVFPDNGSHIWFENHPPTWMPRCECCDQVVWKRILKRPDNVPMEWKPE